MAHKQNTQTPKLNIFNILSDDELLEIFKLLIESYTDIISLVKTCKRFYNLFHTPSYLIVFIKNYLINYPDTRIIWDDIVIFNGNDKTKPNYRYNDINGTQSYKNFLIGVIKTNWYFLYKNTCNYRKTNDIMIEYNMIKLKTYHFSKRFWRYIYNIYNKSIKLDGIFFKYIPIINSNFSYECCKNILTNPKFNALAIDRMIQLKNEGFDEYDCYQVIVFNFTDERINLMRQLRSAGFELGGLSDIILFDTSEEIELMIQLKNAGYSDSISCQASMNFNEEQLQTMILLKDKIHSHDEIYDIVEKFTTQEIYEKYIN